MRRNRLTQSEKAVVVQAARQVLAGDGKGWTVADWKLLEAALEKLSAPIAAAGSTP